MSGRHPSRGSSARTGSAWSIYPALTVAIASLWNAVRRPRDRFGTVGCATRGPPSRTCSPHLCVGGRSAHPIPGTGLTARGGELRYLRTLSCQNHPGFCQHHDDQAAHQPRVQPEHRQRKPAVNSGPVYITDRGKPAYVLLTFADYQRLAANRPNIIELLAQPSEEGRELNLGRQHPLTVKCPVLAHSHGPRRFPGDPDRGCRVPIGWVNIRWRRATFGMPASAVVA